MAEAIGLDLERSRVVLEVLVAHGDSGEVEPGLAEERRVRLVEEPGEQALEEPLGPVVADARSRTSRRISVSFAAYPVMKFSMLSQPPRHTPRRSSGSPSGPRNFDPEVRITAGLMLSSDVPVKKVS